jgi:hypothetical protein
LTRNGKGYAPKGLPYLNIKPGKLDAYANFQLDVLEHFAKEGLPFDYLSPFNEPQWAWDGPGQEGVGSFAGLAYRFNGVYHRQMQRRTRDEKRISVLRPCVPNGYGRSNIAAGNYCD